MANIINPQLHSYGSVPLTPALSAQFETNYRLYSAPAFTDRQRKVLAAMGYIQIVQPQKNYVGAHAALISDTAAWSNGLSNFDFMTAYTVIALTQNYPNQDITQLLTTGNDLLALPEQTLDRILGLLLYRAIVPI